RRLYQPDESGQYAEYAALGAGRNESGWRRLRIHAAIAGSGFPAGRFRRREHAGLSFEAEDAPIHIRLAREHARIINKVARGEVVGTVHHDVKVFEDVERVRARKPRLELAHGHIGIDAV